MAVDLAEVYRGTHAFGVVVRRVDYVTLRRLYVRPG